MRHETLRAFAEACHREYAQLELRMYEEKQKKKELKQEALLREMHEAKSEAYFRGWDDAYRFCKDELAAMSRAERQDSISGQEASRKCSVAWLDRREHKQRHAVRHLEVAAPSVSSGAASSESVPARPLP